MGRGARTLSRLGVEGGMEGTVEDRARATVRCQGRGTREGKGRGMGKGLRVEGIRGRTRLGTPSTTIRASSRTHGRGLRRNGGESDEERVSTPSAWGVGYGLGGSSGFEISPLAGFGLGLRSTIHGGFEQYFT